MKPEKTKDGTILQSAHGYVRRVECQTCGKLLKVIATSVVTDKMTVMEYPKCACS